MLRTSGSFCSVTAVGPPSCFLLGTTASCIAIAGTPKSTSAVQVFTLCSVAFHMYVDVTKPKGKAHLAGGAPWLSVNL